MAYNKQYKDFLEISPNFESVVDIDVSEIKTCGGNILLAMTWKIWWMFYVSRLAMRPRMPGDRSGCMALTALVKAMQLFL